VQEGEREKRSSVVKRKREEMLFIARLEVIYDYS